MFVRLMFVFCATLFSTTLAHAQLWQCPKPEGGFTYQDKPCVAQPVPPEQPQTLGPDRSIPQAQKEKQCKVWGAYASLITAGRDQGKGLIAAINFWSKDDQGRDRPDAAIFRAMVMDIYEHRLWTTSIAKQKVELACLQGLEKTAVSK